MMESASLNEIEQVTEEWILSKMKEFNLKRKHLIAEIGFTKSYFSLLLASEDNPRKIHLTKLTRALFYYYFKTKEISKL